MRKTVLSGIAGMAALFAASAASAQVTVWELSPDQERGLYTTIYQGRGTVGMAPARELDVTIGAVVPEGVELYDVPDAVTYAPAREYRYVLQGNRVIFVEPRTRRVMRVIGP